MTKTILVVEDEMLLQELINYELEGLGYHVLVESTGKAGLKAAQSEPRPDIILLDVQLPGGMDGFEIAKILQANLQTANIPIIFLTARATLADKMTGFKAGGVDYMTKPFSIAELKSRIKATLHRSQIEQDKAKADLEAYKANLSQNMSHELLTPMAKILNGLDVITQLAAQDNITKFDSTVEIIRSGSHELRWIIEDLLLINQISDKNILPFRKAVNLSKIIKAMVEQSEIKFKRKEINFKIDVSDHIVVNIHSKHIQHILHHILDNACKFSPPQGQVEVTVTPIGQAGAKIIIQNEGKGIEADLLEKVFDKFYQVDMAVNRAQDGLGVGLHVARHLARIYDGDIILQSQLNFGTTCQFTIADKASDWI